MARHEEVVMEVINTVALGAAAASQVAELRNITVQIDGTFTATYQIEGSIDGGSFIAIPGCTGIVAPGFFNVPYSVKYLRIKTMAWASGAAQALLGSFNYRSH